MEIGKSVGGAIVSDINSPRCWGESMVSNLWDLVYAAVDDDLYVDMNFSVWDDVDMPVYWRIHVPMAEEISNV